jgi:hypothetical protein
MSLIDEGLKIVSSVLDRVIPDKNARALAKETLASMERDGELKLLLGQLEVNKVEAGHKSMFVSGWRPFVGWTCGIGMAYNFIIYPLLKFIVVISMEMPPELPVLESGELMTLLLGMLGLAGYRTYEKKQQVARD